MVTAVNLKTETGRDAREQVVVKTDNGTKAFISFGHVVAITSPMRATLINSERWESQQTTLKYLKQFLGKSEDMSKTEFRTYLDMHHFKFVSDDVISVLWELETGV